MRHQRDTGSKNGSRDHQTKHDLSHRSFSCSKSVLF
jgi:hypothetical protein